MVRCRSAWMRPAARGDKLWWCIRCRSAGPVATHPVSHLVSHSLKVSSMYQLIAPTPCELAAHVHSWVRMMLLPHIAVHIDGPLASSHNASPDALARLNGG